MPGLTTRTWTRVELTYHISRITLSNSHLNFSHISTGNEIVCNTCKATSGFLAPNPSTSNSYYLLHEPSIPTLRSEPQSHTFLLQKGDPQDARPGSVLHRIRSISKTAIQSPPPTTRTQSQNPPSQQPAPKQIRRSGEHDNSLPKHLPPPHCSPPFAARMYNLF